MFKKLRRRDYPTCCQIERATAKLWQIFLKLLLALIYAFPLVLICHYCVLFASGSKAQK